LRDRIYDMVRTAARSAALAAAIASTTPAQGLVIAEGDLVGIFVKNGVEVIINMGPAEPGRTFNLAGNFDGTGFDGSLVGAKFIGLAVEDPARTVNVPGFGEQLQGNLIYTTEAPDPMPTDDQIDLAMAQLEDPLPGSTAWFNLLRELEGTDVDEIETSELFSYSSVLGLGTDAIANQFSFSTAIYFDENGEAEFPLYSAIRGFEVFGGEPGEYVEIARLTLDVDGGSFEPAPEAPAALALLAGAVALWGAHRARRARA